jgi:hypothetical protein
MLMLDVRNAIAKLLHRYTLADIVEITLRKLRRDNVTPPFLPQSISLRSVAPLAVNQSDRGRRRSNSLKRASEKSRKQAPMKVKR